MQMRLSCTSSVVWNVSASLSGDACLKSLILTIGADYIRFKTPPRFSCSSNEWFGPVLYPDFSRYLRARVRVLSRHIELYVTPSILFYNNAFCGLLRK